jgi:hypothetical protein
MSVSTTGAHDNMSHRSAVRSPQLPVATRSLTLTGVCYWYASETLLGYVYLIGPALTGVHDWSAVRAPLATICSFASRSTV